MDEADSFEDAIEYDDAVNWSKDLDVIPTTSDDETKLKVQYVAAVRAHKTQPQAAFSGICLVCRGEHAFVDCPVLQDTDFLWKHYIDYCRQIRKQDQARKVAFNGTAASLPVNQVSTQRSAQRSHYRGNSRYTARPRSQRYEHPEDEDDTSNVDFQKGQL